MFKYRYGDKGGEGDEDKEGIGSVVLRCYPEASSSLASASAAKNMALT